MFRLLITIFCCGAVAQLGERTAGSRKVRGSIPLSSTNILIKSDSYNTNNRRVTIHDTIMKVVKNIFFLSDIFYIIFSKSCQNTKPGQNMTGLFDLPSDPSQFINGGMRKYAHMKS